jgi:thiol-disulfide isomerase/thioredoxin
VRKIRNFRGTQVSAGGNAHNLSCRAGAGGTEPQGRSSRAAPLVGIESARNVAAIKAAVPPDSEAQKGCLAMRWLYRTALVIFMTGLAASAQSISGHWDGTGQVAPNLAVPLHLELFRTDQQLKGALEDSAQRMVATEGEFSGNAITLRFAQYAVTLRLTLDHETLRGTYSKDNGAFAYPVELTRRHDDPTPPHDVPKIAGLWIIPTESPKGEHAWRLIVHQTGSSASATILRIDGDTGTLAGGYRDGSFHLSHFQDTRPAVLDVTPQADGSLALKLAGPHVGAKPGETTVSLVALRPTSGKDLPKPDDAEGHTSVRDPKQPLRFQFPDLNGKIVANTDPQFKNKVVLVNITGSWCPNCHDEAPYLEELYRKYHEAGFEIVALDFEEPEQQQTLARLHSFLKKYGITYTYLLAGQPSELSQKVPQAVNLNAWPTSFLVGRDGRVHFVETGFPSTGSAGFYSEARRRYAANIEKLLSVSPGKAGE